MKRTSVATLAVSLLAVGAARADVLPIGPDFVVNSNPFPGAMQDHAGACRAPAGQFVIVWRGDSVSGTDVFAQRFTSAGTRDGAEFVVDAYTTGDQFAPAVCCDTAGNFVVVWSSSGQDGDGSGVFARRFTSTGRALGGDLQVNTYTTNDQDNPAVACDAAGDFTVAWTSYLEDGDKEGVFARRFDRDGTPQTSAFQVNTYTTEAQRNPTLTLQPNGFVVAWESKGQDGSNGGVFAQRLGADGSMVGSEFRLNAFTTGTQGAPSVAADGSGNFVVTWYTSVPGSSGRAVRRFRSDGTPLGTEFQVGTTTGASRPSVATDARANFVVAWAGYLPGQPVSDIFGQRFDTNGQPRGTEFQVNTYTAGAQGYFTPIPLALDADGDFVVVWDGKSVNDVADVSARIFQDPCGDGVLGPGEQCDRGNRYSGNCCSESCQLVPTDCGICQTCDASAGCLTRPRPDCRRPAKGKTALLAFTNRSPDTKDRFSFMWDRGAATATSEFGNPLTAPDYTVCVFDQTGQSLAFTATAPAGGTCGGKPCWRAARGKGFTYRDRDGTPDGLTDVVLKSGKAGHALVSVAGRGAHLRLPAHGLAAPVEAEIRAGTGACFGASFASPSRNTATQFRAKGN